MAGQTYSLPDLPYGYKDLEPHISEAQLKLHHDKHHQSYVTGANNALQKLEKARQENADIDLKATLKDLSFQLGGHKLHTIFWQNLAPAGKGGGGEPSGALKEAMVKDYGSFARFKKEFTQAATSAEGSGWAVLTYCDVTKGVGILQVEKHNVNFPPGYPAIMVLDVWEHAYYLDYKNERPKFVEAFWSIVNWKWVGQQFENLRK